MLLLCHNTIQCWTLGPLFGNSLPPHQPWVWEGSVMPTYSGYPLFLCIYRIAVCILLLLLKLLETKYSGKSLNSRFCCGNLSILFSDTDTAIAIGVGVGGGLLSVMVVVGVVVIIIASKPCRWCDCFTGVCTCMCAALSHKPFFFYAVL